MDKKPNPKGVRVILAALALLLCLPAHAAQDTTDDDEDVDIIVIDGGTL